jgi:hypothetical protein
MSTTFPLTDSEVALISGVNIVSGVEGLVSVAVAYPRRNNGSFSPLLLLFEFGTAGISKSKYN